VAEGKPLSSEETELKAALEAVLSSPSQKKLVIAGPGTGKTVLFKQMLELATGEPDRRIVLTFINTLKDDLKDDLAGLAEVFTLHSYCLGLLHSNATLRAPLSPNFCCFPGLASLIRRDWELIERNEAPQFVGEMRGLAEDNNIPFYLARGQYYDAVDFDDTVYRVYEGLASGRVVSNSYDLVLIDEYQDFNSLEAGLIEVLGKGSPIVIAGDDDQALYSQLRGASCDHIRQLRISGEYEVFELPFCMRCPKVVFDAVNDVLAKASNLQKLKRRINKPFKHFPPVKGLDSEKYPRIALVETSIQRRNVNYMGRYIAQAVEGIPHDEIVEAACDGYPAALVIVAQPYRGQIIECLESKGFEVDTRRELESQLKRETGLSILKKDRSSNLGWRIILAVDAQPSLRDVIAATADGSRRLVDVLTAEFRESVLDEADAYEPPEEDAEEEQGIPVPANSPSVRVTSFEGAKGLSAQHVFMAGLHNDELPHDPKAIQDLEICKFVVGLTRTRKQCSLIYTRNFAGHQKSRSSFISWIDPSRLNYFKVDAAYWQKHVED